MEIRYARGPIHTITSVTLIGVIITKVFYTPQVVKVKRIGPMSDFYTKCYLYLRIFLFQKRKGGISQHLLLELVRKIDFFLNMTHQKKVNKQLALGAGNSLPNKILIKNLIHWGYLNIKQVIAWILDTILNLNI